MFLMSSRLKNNISTQNEHAGAEFSGNDSTPNENSANTAQNQQNTSQDRQMSGAEAGATSADEEVEVLKKRLDETTAKLSDTQDRMLRIAADFENARKRWEKEKSDIRQYSIQEFARDLLPVIDAFDKAMAAIDSLDVNFDNGEGKKFGAVVEGVQLVSRVFQESVKKHGIEKLPGKGELFNPMYHNAVAKIVDSSVTQETVIDEYTSGYKIGDRILRTAMVRVATPD